MGEYIKNRITGEEIKIGVMDECFFSRQQIKKWLDDPDWTGWYGDKEEAGTMEYYYNNPDTLYKDIEGLTHNYNTLIVVYDEIASLVHEKVQFWQKGKRGNEYQYELACQFEGKLKMCVSIVGERYNRGGVGRTIFACDCCGTLLNLPQNVINKALEKEDESIRSYLKPLLKGSRDD